MHLALRRAPGTPKGPIVFVLRLALTALLITCAPAAAIAAVSPADAAKADAQRKKPLQRCDQLEGDAEVECLKKARERIVEARQKREGEAKGQGEAKGKEQGATPAKKQDASSK